MGVLVCHLKLLSSIKNRLLWSKISYTTYQFDKLWDYLKLKSFDLHFLAMPRWESKYKDNKFNFSWTLKKLFHVNLKNQKWEKMLLAHQRDIKVFVWREAFDNIVKVRLLTYHLNWGLICAIFQEFVGRLWNWIIMPFLENIWIYKSFDGMQGLHETLILFWISLFGLEKCCYNFFQDLCQPF